MMKNILLVGKNSFIASNLVLMLKQYHNVDHISHTMVNDVPDTYDIIINCALHPLYRSELYLEDNDIDLRLSRMFSGHYMMISSRKVYGTNDDLYTYTEESPVNPNDYYGSNKWVTESMITKEKQDCTIFRCSNVFGFELGRKTFLGLCLSQLKEKGMIELDFDHATKKDFIDIDSVCKLITAVCDHPFVGTYNLSSNIAYSIGNLTSNLFTGYGSGYIVCKNEHIKDQFMLSNKKLLDKLDKNNYDFNIDANVIELGRRLCKI